MPLPKIEHPTFGITLPSNGATVRYRAFTGKEQKILLTAKDAKDTREAMRAIADVAQSCVQGSFNVYDMPIFDLEYLFIMIRAKSVSNASDIRISDEDGVIRDARVNLDDVKVTRNDKHDELRIVKLTATQGIKLKYPTVKSVIEGGSDADELDVLISSIDTIFDGEEVMSPKDFTPKEMKEWVTTLPIERIGQVKEFFETRPKVSMEAVYTDRDKKQAVKKIEGLSDFFESA